MQRFISPASPITNSELACASAVLAIPHANANQAAISVSSMCGAASSLMRNALGVAFGARIRHGHGNINAYVHSVANLARGTLGSATSQFAFRIAGLKYNNHALHTPAAPHATASVPTASGYLHDLTACHRNLEHV